MSRRGKCPLFNTSLLLSVPQSKYPLPLIAFGQAAGVVIYTILVGRFIVSEFQSFSLTIAKFFSMGITVIRHSTKGSLALARDCVSAAEPPDLSRTWSAHDRDI